jgi:hypothetical protein
MPSFQSDPALPLIDLRHGLWRARVFDPRPDPLALGARYVHGGYVAELWRGERCLTAAPTMAWDRFHGRGMPETFEFSLGQAQVRDGEEYLRIGAGRLRRGPSDLRETAVRQPLCGTVRWEISAQGDDHVSMRCCDRTESMDWIFGYELERELRLSESGLSSTTRLSLQLGQLGQCPLLWFPHPFFAHGRTSATAFSLPEGTKRIDRVLPPWMRAGPVNECERGEDGRWRFTAANGDGRRTFGGIWGSRDPIIVHLDPTLGGGAMAMTCNRPLDHLVIWANDRTASPEPKLARALLDRETAEWTLDYRWQD